MVAHGWSMRQQVSLGYASGILRVGSEFVP
jgi:hypothetical protein